MAKTTLTLFPLLEVRNGDFSLMKKDKSIYTFNFNEITNLTQLCEKVKELPQFNQWTDSLGLSPYLQKNFTLILNALIHTSFVHEQPQMNLVSYERLEFLGDAFLDSEISLMLWQQFPGLSEGQLSKFRSSLVNEEILADWGRALKLDHYIFLGKGEATRKSVERAIIADCFEALIGALALIDRSAIYDLLRLWMEKFNEESELPYFSMKRLELFDPKTQLQEYTLELYKVVPHYHSEEDEKEGFLCRLTVLDKVLAEATGKSKKRAEMAAAKKVLIKENYKSLNHHQE